MYIRVVVSTIIAVSDITCRRIRTNDSYRIVRVTKTIIVVICIIGKCGTTLIECSVTILINIVIANFISLRIDVWIVVVTIVVVCNVTCRRGIIK